MAEGFRKFYWGFLLIMLSFRIGGFDILPDIIGFIFIASGLEFVITESEFFKTAKKYTLPMILLSIFTIYESPVQGDGINFGYLGPLGIVIWIASVILTLLLVYNLLMGIQDMAKKRSLASIAEEAGRRWEQFLWLEIAGLFTLVLLVIPPLAIIFLIGLLIASIVIAIGIIGFMKKCEENIQPIDTDVTDF